MTKAHNNKKNVILWAEMSSNILMFAEPISGHARNYGSHNSKVQVTKEKISITRYGKAQSSLLLFHFCHKLKLIMPNIDMPSYVISVFLCRYNIKLRVQVVNAERKLSHKSLLSTTHVVWTTFIVRR